jgi:hypothetical protein
MRSVEWAALEIFSTRPPAKPFLANTSIAARNMLSRVATRPDGRPRAGFLAAGALRGERSLSLAIGNSPLEFSAVSKIMCAQVS